MKTFSKLLFNIMMALFVGMSVAVENPVAGFTLGVGMGAAGLFVSLPAGVLASTIQIQIWEDFIASNLFKGYEWLRTYSRSRDRNVMMGKFVYIPQAGAEPEVVRNRETFPINVTRRADTTLMYEIDEFSTETISIPEADKIELSYDKMDDVLQDHMKALNREVARWTLYNWAPTAAANIVPSTGASAAAYLTGATGNRKKFLVADIGSGKTVLNNQTKKEQGNRVAIMREDAYNQLKSDSSIQSKDNHDRYGAVWSKGDLVEICGFKIVRTDVMPRWTNAATPVKKAPSAANAATDEDAILLIDADFVHLAQGTIKFFGATDDPTYQADIYSAQVRAGSSPERTNTEGVVAVHGDTV